MDRQVVVVVEVATALLRQPCRYSVCPSGCGSRRVKGWSAGRCSRQRCELSGYPWTRSNLATWAATLSRKIERGASEFRWSAMLARTAVGKVGKLTHWPCRRIGQDACTTSVRRRGKASCGPIESVPCGTGMRGRRRRDDARVWRALVAGRGMTAETASQQRGRSAATRRVRWVVIACLSALSED